MLNIDNHGNIHCKMGDRLILDYGLSKSEPLTVKDKVTLTITFKGETSRSEFTPDSEGIVKITLLTTEVGSGDYEIMVTKEDQRQEVTNYGQIIVY